MDLSNTLSEISSLSVDDKITLVQAIWDSIAAEQDCINLDSGQIQELDRRLADQQENPDHMLIWEQVRASIEQK